MKKINNKGFSLVEVLAVIVIIGAFSALVVPDVASYINKSKNEYVYGTKKILVLVAKDFYSEHKYRLLNDDESIISKDYVTVSELESLGYFSGDLKDDDGNDCSKKSYVVAVNEGLGNEYYSCLICAEKEYFDADEEEFCDLNID